LNATSSLPRVILKARRARPFFARHPWVFVTSIDAVSGAPKPGDEVEVYSHEGKFVARGIFNPHSAIRVRLYRWDGGPVDDEFLTGLVTASLKLRTEILRQDDPKGAARLVSSEGDGLSGLTVDRYARWLVAQFTSLALFERRDMLVRVLQEQTEAEGILCRTERVTAEQEGIAHPFEHLIGSLPGEPMEIVEHGIAYWVDPRAGQKTGFFLDQRDNRLAVARYCRDRDVLDLYSYTGGFALNALKSGQARSVLGVESSAVAAEVARHHATMNGLDDSKITFEASDALSVLERLRSEGRKFGVVICDPPKFARNPRGVEDALKAYLRLNRSALDVLEPDGILATCSCSGLVDRDLFADMLAQVAELSGRSLQFLEQRGQAADHPVSASCLETDYLKCMICRVV
jgi:23S rRNA (cytosine1962-C5)-methyltransferase